MGLPSTIGAKREADTIVATWNQNDENYNKSVSKKRIDHLDKNLKISYNYQTSDIRGTKYQNFNVSRLVLFVFAQSIGAMC